MSENRTDAPTAVPVPLAFKAVRAALRPALAFAGIAVLFELILVAKWAQIIDKGFVYLINGLLPWSDAITYFAGARQLAMGFPVEPWIGKRPLFTGMLASVLAASGHNLQVIQVVLVLINAWATFLLIRELKRSYGLTTSLTSLALITLFYQRFVGMTSTEHLGLAAGCIALAVLVRGARMQSMRLVWIGLFGIAYALVARAGAFLVLPVLLAWGAWHCRANRRDPEMAPMVPGFRFRASMLRFLGVGLAAMALAFAIDGVLRQVLTPGTQAFNNFSSTLYGVVVGNKGWLKILHDHPELTRMQDYEAAPLIYRYAFEAIQAHPGVALKGVLSTYQQFFASPGRNAFSFINTNPLLDSFPSVTLLLVSIAGIVLCMRSGPAQVPVTPGFRFRGRRDPSYTLILAFMLGIILSVPALPPVDAEFMRAYAATIPAQTVIVGLGLQTLIGLAMHRKMPEPVEDRSEGAVDGKIVLWTGAALLVLSFLLPIGFSLLIPRSHPPVTAAYQGQCPAGQETVGLYLAPGANMHLTDKTAAASFAPDIRITDFRGQLRDNLQIWPEAIRLLRKLQPGQTLLTTLDENGRSVWAIVDTQTLPASGSMMVVCAQRDPVEPDQQRFYYVVSVLDVVR